jgi:hypothetical protein
MNTLASEQDITNFLKITPQKLRRLRLSKQIPFLRVDRYTRLYDIEKVVAALEAGTKEGAAKG